jgi:hypothetical protein
MTIVERVPVSIRAVGIKYHWNRKKNVLTPVTAMTAMFAPPIPVSQMYAFTLTMLHHATTVCTVMV